MHYNWQKKWVAYFFDNLDGQEAIKAHGRSSTIETQKQMEKYKAEDEILGKDVWIFKEGTLVLSYHRWVERDMTPVALLAVLYSLMHGSFHTH